MKTNHKKLMFTRRFLIDCGLCRYQLLYRMEDCARDHSRKGEAEPCWVLMSNGNGLWQCRGEKDQWVQHSDMGRGQAQLDTDCYVNSADASPDYAQNKDRACDTA